MKVLTMVLLAGVVVLGLGGCGESSSNRTTTVVKETRVDSNGNEKTKIETTTKESTVQTDTTPANTTVHTIEVKKENDPVIKIGPLEIKN